MRLVSVLVLTGCSTTGAVAISPADNSVPLGLGLTQIYDVTQELCDGGIDGGCDLANPSQIAVTIVDGTAVAIAGTNLDPSRGLAQLSLTGAAIGMSRVLVMGDGGNGISTPISVAAVAATKLSVERPSGTYGSSFPDVASPIYAFTGSTFPIAQHSFEADTSAVRGAASLALAPGETSVAFDPACNCFATGTVLGTATISAPLASLKLDVVDATAIADFTLDGAAAGDTIELVIGGTTLVALLPTDSAHHAIVGLGPEPQLTISGGAGVSLSGDDSTAAVRSLNFFPSTPGTATLDVQWGPIHRTFTLNVVTLDELPPL